MKERDVSVVVDLEEQKSFKLPSTNITPLEWIVSLLVIALLAAILVPNFKRTADGSPFTPCKSNLKNIGTAMEMYSTDNLGRYATCLAKLTPNYLKVIPTCASRGADTYSGGFTSHSNPDAYTVVCSGKNHAGVNLAPNYPQYTSIQGLIAM